MRMTCKLSKSYRMRKNQVSLTRKVVNFRKKRGYERSPCAMKDQLNKEGIRKSVLVTVPQNSYKSFFKHFQLLTTNIPKPEPAYFIIFFNLATEINAQFTKHCHMHMHTLKLIQVYGC